MSPTYIPPLQHDRINHPEQRQPQRRPIDLYLQAVLTRYDLVAHREERPSFPDESWRPHPQRARQYQVGFPHGDESGGYQGEHQEDYGVCAQHQCERSFLSLAKNFQAFERGRLKPYPETALISLRLYLLVPRAQCVAALGDGSKQASMQSSVQRCRFFLYQDHQ